MTTAIETKERLTPGPASSAVLWEYAPSPESTDHVKVASRYNLFIGGKFVEPHSKRWFGFSDSELTSTQPLAFGPAARIMPILLLPGDIDLSQESRL